MKRFELTTAGALTAGDVFYKASDKSKQKFEIVNAKIKVTPHQVFSVFARKHGSIYPEALKKDTKVVFLRGQEF